MEKKDDSLLLDYYNQLKNYLDYVIVGEERAKKALVMALMCDNNSRILLIGDPGTGKTILVKSLANILKSTRIQITADLLPSEIIELLKDKTDIELLHSDEANRVSPKTQAVLIELYEENQITTETEPIKFHNFYVMATQNDKDSGIWATPNAMRDRYGINIILGNLTDDERDYLHFEYKKPDLEKLPKNNLKEIAKYTAKKLEDFIPTREDREIFKNAFRIINARRYTNGQKLFASSNVRAEDCMIKLAKLNALINGRGFIMPRDIADFIPNVYQHRIDQNLIKPTDEEAIKIMEDLENSILDLERENKVTLNATADSKKDKPKAIILTNTGIKNDDVKKKKWFRR